MRATNFIAILLATCPMFVGCSEPEKRLQISGKVLIDSEPLPFGTIRFVPEKGRAVSSAILADGSFQLSASSVGHEATAEGVVPGSYKIAVSASKIRTDGEETAEWLAPSHYADFNTSGLEADLQSDRDDLVIELTWQGSHEENNDPDTEDLPSENSSSDVEKSAVDSGQEPDIQKQE